MRLTYMIVRQPLIFYGPYAKVLSLKHGNVIDRFLRLYGYPHKIANHSRAYKRLHGKGIGRLSKKDNC